VIVICGDVSKAFIKTTTRVEDDLTKIIRLTVSATAKQKPWAVSSCMFTTCQACLRAVGGHLQHVQQSYITEPVNVIPSMGGFADSMSEFRFMLGIVYNTPSEYLSLCRHNWFICQTLIFATSLDLKSKQR
jgi:hypothetical protein